MLVVDSDLWDEILAVIHDEDTAHIELDLVRLLLRLEHIEWCTLWYIQQGLELKLTLNGEVLHSEVILPIVRERLVEGG